MKTALVLSGGGFKGAFQVGALQYMRENWDKLMYMVNGNNRQRVPVMHFDIVSGVSVGALNGLLVAMGSMDKLIDLWKDVEQKGASAIYSSDLFTIDRKSGKINIILTLHTLRKCFPRTFRYLVLKLFSMKWLARDLKEDLDHLLSLASNAPLCEKLFAMLAERYPRQLINQITSRQCSFLCGFVPLTTGIYVAPQHREYLNDRQLLNAVIASSTIPMLWNPVDKINTFGRTFMKSVDGGIVNVSPLGDVLEAIEKDTSGEDYFIIIINCSNGSVEKQDEIRNIAQVAMRSISDIAITEIFNSDLREFINVNSILKHLQMTQITYPMRDPITGAMLRKTRRQYKYMIIQPGSTLGNTLDAGEEQIRRRYEAGRKAAASMVSG